MTPEALKASLELARELGQVPEGADFSVPSSRGYHFYGMVYTPEGFAVHHGAGCEAETFHGPLSCRHSKEFSTMTSALVPRDATLTPTPLEFTHEQLVVIKESICKGATDAELALFVATCKRTGLDPFLKQIYAVKRYDSREKKEVMAIQVGIDGMRLTAERTGKYGGQGPVEYLDNETGEWSEIWHGKGYPYAARVTVYRKDWAAGAHAICRWDSYAQHLGADQKLSSSWQRMPDVMLGKCAESLAMRRAFPAEMSGMAAVIDPEYDAEAEIAEVSLAAEPITEDATPLKGGMLADNDGQPRKENKPGGAAPSEVPPEQPALEMAPTSVSAYRTYVMAALQAAGHETDTIIAVSQRLFGNREPAQLSPKELQVLARENGVTLPLPGQ